MMCPLRKSDWVMLVELAKRRTDIPAIDSSFQVADGGARNRLNRMLQLIVADRRKLGCHMEKLLDRLGEEIRGVNVLPMLPKHRINSITDSGPDEANDDEMCYLLTNTMELLRLSLKVQLSGSNSWQPVRNGIFS